MRGKTKEEIKNIDGFDYEKFFEEDEWHGLFEVPESNYFELKYYSLKRIIADMSQRIKKLELLTKANEYEYEVSTIAKLIKKDKKEK